MAEPADPQSAVVAAPDLMNDPEYATNTNDEDGTADADTCRICRGEAADGEPLFYPCKCSGSIKFVHQDCLMEWLSHSQKKHCELCKTPFRFTKLYSPNMPQSLPVHVFARQFVVHMANNVMTWLRFCLVILVWLGVLPWLIRQVWKLLFWFSDGGWPAAKYYNLESLRENSTAIQALELAADFLGTGTSPANPHFAVKTSAPSQGPLMEKLTGFLTPFSQNFNVTASDNSVAGLLQSILYGIGVSGGAMPEGRTSTSSFLPEFSQSSTPSLLSEISWLKNLTRFPYANNLFVSILEGYIITVSVVVAFILVFLIREWVVQQQPGINMGAGFNADFAAGRVQDDFPNPPAEDPAALEAPPREREAPARLIARPRRRLLQPENADIQRPPPDPDVFGTAIIPRAPDSTNMTAEFTSIWRSAGGDPAEVLRIIESRDLSDRMEYWVREMEKMVARSESSNAAEAGFDALLPLKAQAKEEGDGDTSEAPSSNSDGWTDLRDHSGNSQNQPTESMPKLDKGKGKQPEDSQNSFDLATASTPSDQASQRDFPMLKPPVSLGNNSIGQNPVTRPRATSDGPLRREISPLANDSWSFSALDDIEPTGESKKPVSVKEPVSEDHGAAWKASQDLRVQHAVTKAIAAVEKSSEDTKSDAGEAGPSLEASATLEGPFVQNIEAWYPDGSNSEESADEDDDMDGRNTFVPDAPQPEPLVPLIPRPANQGLMENVADWLWGGPRDDGLEGDEEHVVEDLAAEAPFVRVNRDMGQDPGEEQDREVVEAAMAAGIDLNDADVIDDAEDFEGIMELVGMRGPLFGLVQNALFSAFLLALTVAFGVWIPYNIGRVSLLLIANPGPAFKLPLRLMFGCAAFLQDLAVVLLSAVWMLLLQMWRLPIDTYFFVRGMEVPDPARAMKLGFDTVSVCQAAWTRIADGFTGSLHRVAESELFYFSAASHEALLDIKSTIAEVFTGIGHAIVYLVVGDYRIGLSSFFGGLSSLMIAAWSSRSLLSAIPSILARPDSWVISLGIAKRLQPIDPELSVWGDVDRIWAILAGYTTLCVIGALYVRKGSPFTTTQMGREWEATIIDLLNQAGGVMKVILIISIEMLVFPLYCGLLLDTALLPLFEDATIMSRILFTFKSPLTSIFVHWFVGTCYMFHFALFVSMCRKIMRKGVLYFIRDPDDPTFHPVRDVLERNVATQLRKILFSALVYGALVVICLGGVVWGLSFAFAGVLPIHWSSNEPVLEFPIDLLFYNFLMPLAVKFFKPSDGLQAMYTWWFRQCARMLRLTWFMFGERKEDEEGKLILRRWTDIFRRTDAAALPTVKEGEGIEEKVAGDEPYLLIDGKYVRAPASDQVRLPKGSKIFLEVDENNNRIDGKWDSANGVFARQSDLYTQVYIPPWFRLRICIFIVLIWFFAAFTGVSITIVPLVFGRRMFAKIIPSDVQQNDVYAFSIGVYILGSALYAMLHIRYALSYLHANFVWSPSTLHHFARRARDITARTLAVIWVWTAFLILLPTLYAFVVEFYIIVPAHTYMAPHETHTVRFVQTWTLGLLYVKLTSRLILWYEDTRPAMQLRAIVRKGYFEPDARIATRSFILPGGLVLGSLLGVPWALARCLEFLAGSPLGGAALLHPSPYGDEMMGLGSPEDYQRMLLYRGVYPCVLGIGLMAIAAWAAVGMVRGWRQKIKDEVYLIGERLHNFGDRKAGGGVPVVRRIGG